MNYEEILNEDFEDIDFMVEDAFMSDSEVESLEAEFEEVCSKELDSAEQNIEVKNSSFLQAYKSHKGVCMKCGKPLKACKCGKATYFKRKEN